MSADNQAAVPIVTGSPPGDFGVDRARVLNRFEAPQWLGRVQVRCGCGETVTLSGPLYKCTCGRALGNWDGEKGVLAGAAPYRGEVPLRQMQDLLELSERDGWRTALARLLPELPVGFAESITEEKRGFFHELMPLREDGVVLDLGTALGRTAVEFARKYHVIALGEAAEQTRFIALRARQDGLSERLAVVQGHVDGVNFLPGQFSAVVIDALPPRRPEATRFLSSLKTLLAPGGIIYLAGENRIGWRRLSRRLRGQRGSNIHSYAGYMRLIAASGLKIRSSYVSPRGFDDPTLLVPLEQRAIYYYSRRMLPPAGHAARMHLINVLHMVFAREWVWRRFGSDFVFFLEASDA